MSYLCSYICNNSYKSLLILTKSSLGSVYIYLVNNPYKRQGIFVLVIDGISEREKIKQNLPRQAASITAHAFMMMACVLIPGE